MNWLWQIFDPANIGAFVTQFQTEMTQPAFWVAVGKIIWINILLSGDNALVIALACRGLSPKHRLWGMILGAGAAVFLRIIFTGIVVTLMELPYLKLVGGLALIVIAAKLLVPEQEDEDGVESASHLWASGKDRRRRRHRHEPRQCDRGGRRRQRKCAAIGARPGDQRSPDRRRCGPDHGVADLAAASGLGGCRPARLDRRRCHRHRSGHSPEARCAVLGLVRRQARPDAGVAWHRTSLCQSRQRAANSFAACSASSWCWQSAQSGASARCKSTLLNPQRPEIIDLSNCCCVGIAVKISRARSPDRTIDASGKFRAGRHLRMSHKWRRS